MDDVSSEFVVCSLLHGEEATDNYQDTQSQVPVSPGQTKSIVRQLQATKGLNGAKSALSPQ